MCVPAWCLDRWIWPAGRLGPPASTVSCSVCWQAHYSLVRRCSLAEIRRRSSPACLYSRHPACLLALAVGLRLFTRHQQERPFGSARIGAKTVGTFHGWTDDFQFALECQQRSLQIRCTFRQAVEEQSPVAVRFRPVAGPAAAIPSWTSAARLVTFSFGLGLGATIIYSARFRLAKAGRPFRRLTDLESDRLQASDSRLFPCKSIAFRVRSRVDRARWCDI